MIRVLLVDDEAETRAILRDYLLSDARLEIVGEAADGQVALQQTIALRPDVILMDMQMPVMDGVSSTREIHRAFPDIAVLGLSTFSTDRYVIDLLRAGASGYLVKDAPPDELIDAVRRVAAGDSVLSPEVTRHVVRGLGASVPAEITPDSELAGVLSEKELEAVRLLAEGMSNREIAEALCITESAVKGRLVKVMEKLGVRDRVQILVTAISRGLVDVKRGPRLMS
ncbi:DNA-binding response regulator [Leucobacter sp. wl10]|nr:DNA-binding response regulator [Leucobacter sp. wl10]